MIRIGNYNHLRILRETSVGLFLGDEEGEDVLLPNKYCPEEYELDDMIHVFVYLDYDERKIATNITPKIHLYEFAFLEVAAVSDYGAHLDWGLEKHLLVPFREQVQKMEVGKSYVVCLDIDTETDRLYASNRVDRLLQNSNLTIKEGEEVGLMVYKETEMGFSVIINDEHKGLVFQNEVFQPINIGDKLQGYVKKIREENKVDISLQPIGYQNFNSKNSELIYNALKENDSFLAVTDKSPPALIYNLFGISKKAFKKAVGDLYKQRKIKIEPTGIKLI